jgi:uncharacterized protein
MIEILLSSFLGYFGAKCIKFLIGLYHQEKSLWKKFLITGGMPSAHASVTTALSTSIFLFEGLNSTFVLSLVLLIIVARDAIGVRKSTGEQGEILKKISKKKFNISHGHTIQEVSVGMILGFSIALLTYLL